METRQTSTSRATRPTYLLAAVLIWIAVAASLAAGPAPEEVQAAALTCGSP
jgi:hypothetical protein